MYYVYILKSINYRKHYVGQTKDLVQRIKHHNSKSARWTLRYQPWELVYFEEHITRAEAMKRERYLKSLKNIDKVMLCNMPKNVLSQESHPDLSGLVAGSSPVSRSD